MLLAMDIGNTNIKVGLFQKKALMHSWRMGVDKQKTADEYGVLIESFFTHLHLPTEIISGIMISSVIPSLNYTIEHMCNIYFPKISPLFVDVNMRLDLAIDYEHPQSLGTDRICTAVAANKLYGGTIITIDFGTATTFGAIKDGCFLGGMICPGYKVSTNALIDNTALLPKVEFIRPERIIGKNTEHCMQAGILFGYVGQVEYLVMKAKQELGTPVTVIGTGGLGDLIVSETNCIDFLNPTLTLEGLNLIYDMNK